MSKQATKATETTVIVPANPDLDDCLSGAAEAYIAEHPELAGWDLEPRWADETRETIALTIPAWATSHVITYANGTTETHGTYAEAVAALARHDRCEIGHPGDPTDGGDRTLAWADAESAQNDDGQRAVATIRRVEA